MFFPVNLTADEKANTLHVTPFFKENIVQGELITIFGASPEESGARVLPRDEVYRVSLFLYPSTNSPPFSYYEALYMWRLSCDTTAADFLKCFSKT